MIDIIQFTPVKSTVFKNVIIRWIKKLRAASDRWYVLNYVDDDGVVHQVCTDTLEEDGIAMKRLWATIPKLPITDEPVIDFPHIDMTDGLIYRLHFSDAADIVDEIGVITGKNTYNVGYDSDFIYLKINDNLYQLASIMKVLPNRLPDFNPVRKATINYLSHSEMDTIRYGGFVTFNNEAGYKFRITKSAFRVMGVDRPDLPAKFDMGYGFYTLDSKVMEILSNSIIEFDRIAGVVVKQTFTDIGFSAYGTAVATMY